MAERTGHSVKPDEVRNRISQLCGDLPRIELFARIKTDGWDVFGNEVEGSVNLETSANNVIEAVTNKDSDKIIKLMKSMKPRSRKQGRMIRKAEKLMKYPTLIGYAE